MSGHAFLAPSAAHVWSKCPRSPRAALETVDYSSQEDADIGTAAHEAIVSNREVASNSVPITQEMRVGAQLFHAQLAPHALLEQRIAIPVIHPVHCWGTPDAHFTIGRTLHVLDYKFGHRYVEVFENPQLICYAAGLFNPQMHDSIVLTVVQPRCYQAESVRPWTLSSRTLLQHIDRLAMHARIATSDSPPYKAGVHCTDCKARHACPELRRVGYQLTDMAESRQATELDATALSVELGLLQQASKLLEARLSGLEAHAEALLNRGVPVPGYEMAEGRTHRRWTVSAEELARLDPRLIEMKAISPAEAEEIIDKDVINRHTERPKGKRSLKPIDMTKLRKGFSNG